MRGHATFPIHGASCASWPATPSSSATASTHGTSRKEGAHKTLTAEGLVSALNLASEADKALYLEAFKKSDFEAMLNYYVRNHPREPYAADAGPLPNAAMPVLMFHGLGDRALNAAALDRTWEWLDKDLTLVTVPGAGHWVHHDAAPLVTQTMKWWLAMRRGP